MRPFCAALLILSLLVATAGGHDYWLQADSFYLQPGAHTLLHLHVGSSFESELERPLQKLRTIRFAMLSHTGARDLLAGSEDGRTPVADVTVQRPGNYLLVMERTPQLIALEAAKFKDYLSEEGLDSIIKMRSELGEAGADGRERYTRYLKALLQVGEQRDETYKQITNQRLEIVPRNNPYSLKIGGTLKLKVLFEGRPLAGARIFAYNRANGETQTHTLSARLAADGQASFTLDRAGVWLIRLVHMRRCINCADADWESFWAAYTFELR